MKPILLTLTLFTAFLLAALAELRAAFTSL